MIKKIKVWFQMRKLKRANPYLHTTTPNQLYTREQLEKAFVLGYNDGKRDGLAIAREQAIKSLKEILWQQNQKKNY